MGAWQRTKITNLIKRASSGIYYCRVRVGGKEYKSSLGTTVYNKARFLLPDEVARLKKLQGAGGGSSVVADISLRVTVENWFKFELARPDIKINTSKCFRQIQRVFSETLPKSCDGDKFGVLHFSRWWSSIALKFSPSYANVIFSYAVKFIDLQISAGYRVSKAYEGSKRMKVKRRVWDVLSSEDLLRLIDCIRSSGFLGAGEYADLVYFLASTGMRPVEARHLVWSDVGVDAVTVTGGAKGTKNYSERVVPLTAGVSSMLEQRREASGFVWSVGSPGVLMLRAVESLGLPRQTPYSLRRFFATRALEKGVDVATVALWMGHKDGGSLLLRTYVNVRSQHGLEMIAKMDF